MPELSTWIVLLFASLFFLSSANAQEPKGYYRHPALFGDTIVFVAEGDLWKVSVKGGQAMRLTSHAGDEALPAISPDGRTVAFTASYEGPTEIYTMPLAGGLPSRLTYDGSRIDFVGWTPDGKVLFGTRKYSTLPNTQLVVIDPNKKGSRQIVPLAQAADGCFDPTGKTVYFTRLPFQGSHTKRYKGGTAQNIWKFTKGAAEAVPLTSDYAGTSRRPQWWQGRIYFVSDRSGIMNLWSMLPTGKDLRQHTKHTDWDIAKPSLHNGKAVYQLGADLWLFDIAKNQSKKLDVTISSDLDQQRENWVEKPMDYLTSAHVSADGKKVILTARGQLFVVPVDQGRLVEIPIKQGVRSRAGRFLPDGKNIVALSDTTGEVELWQYPANGVDVAKQLTKNGKVLRWDTVPSPDGKWIVHHDKDQQLWLLEVKTGKDKKIDYSPVDSFTDITWSPDSQWLAYVESGDNLFNRIKLFHVKDGKQIYATSDRYGSYSPAWSPDGKWLYFLSDRNLQSVVGSPWGTYQPEPFLDKQTKVYQLALQKGLRSPFAPDDELHDESDKSKKVETKKEDKDKDKKKDTKVSVDIVLDGLSTRLLELPIPAGNYGNLSVNDKSLFFTSRPAGGKSSLVGVTIARKDVEVKTIASGISGYEMSQDGKHLLVRQSKSLHVIDAAVKPADLGKNAVSLSNWHLSVIPREEWRQMFLEAWRLERDYFYDRNLHGIDWPAMRDKYLPLVDRVRSRAELSDVVAQMVSELSALHIFVRGGDQREGEDKIAPASLGAILERDEQAGGYRIEHIYQTDPDEPKEAGPLARFGIDVKEGDVITMINGRDVLSVPEIGMLLRQKAGQQTLLQIKKKANGKLREVIVRPIAASAEDDLRYDEWEYTRRLEVEKKSKNDIGYVHLRAMGGGNFTEWAKNYYPVFTRKGLIIDVRNNRGGNIDSWILNRLVRKAWFYWNQHQGKAPMWNMQYAFRGHIVVLCNEYTASDGEAFSEGIKRLKLGKVIGTRTWGGEIWLSSSNFLVDKGIATAAEFGVYGPEGIWLIEGHGVEPDIVVDNLPHATFNGKDAQLEAAIRHLQKRIKEDPIPVPDVPKFPDKSFTPAKQQPMPQAQAQPLRQRLGTGNAKAFAETGRAHAYHQPEEIWHASR